MMKLTFSDKGIEDAEAIEIWWRENRPAAPGRFIDELVEACKKAIEHPFAYMVYDVVDGVEMRRVRLEQTRQHVYFSTHADTVTVHRIWGGQRDKGPKLNQRSTDDDD